MPDAPLIRPATPADADAIVAITRELIADGGVFPHTADQTDAELRAFWYAPHGHLFAAELDGALAGAYMFKPNQPGRGAHVANAAYAVAERFRGRRLGEAMGRHSLDEARRAGFRAMQYNLVVSTNEPAVALWQKIGFAVLCRLPEAFHHPTRGYVDALVMHRFL
jgi:ribosomal protein S18 acetylase RimI-like enzyme